MQPKTLTTTAGGGQAASLLQSHAAALPAHVMGPKELSFDPGSPLCSIQWHVQHDLQQKVHQI